jgi:ubiquinone/menaquinone biosynthesis C-methylase UbiE
VSSIFHRLSGRWFSCAYERLLAGGDWLYTRCMADTLIEGAFLDTDRITSLLGIAEGMHVADLGCGSGHFTISMARAVGTSGVVSAVDVQTGPLESVQAKAESLGLGNIRPIRADLEVSGGTGIADNSQDAVLLANTLFQSQKKEAMIREAVRMLKSGGRLVVIEWKKGAGGFGPPDQLRTSEDEMKKEVESQSVRFQRPLDAGRFYYGLVFIKP